MVSSFEPGTETELPIGERGEICICTPTVMKGYYNKPEHMFGVPAHYQQMAASPLLKKKKDLSLSLIHI